MTRQGGGQRVKGSETGSRAENGMQGQVGWEVEREAERQIGRETEEEMGGR